jgi:hypothetical protein
MLIKELAILLGEKLKFEVVKQSLVCIFQFQDYKLENRRKNLLNINELFEVVDLSSLDDQNLFHY